MTSDQVSTLMLRSVSYYDDEGDLTLHKAYEFVCNDICKQIVAVVPDGWHMPEKGIEMIRKKVGSWGAGWCDEHYGGCVAARCVMERNEH